MMPAIDLQRVSKNMHNGRQGRNPSCLLSSSFESAANSGLRDVNSVPGWRDSTVTGLANNGAARARGRRTVENFISAIAGSGSVVENSKVKCWLKGDRKRSREAALYT